MPERKWKVQPQRYEFANVIRTENAGEAILNLGHWEVHVLC